MPARLAVNVFAQAFLKSLRGAGVEPLRCRACAAGKSSVRGGGGANEPPAILMEKSACASVRGDAFIIYRQQRRDAPLPPVPCERTAIRASRGVHGGFAPTPPQAFWKKLDQKLFTCLFQAAMLCFQHGTV